MTFLAATLLALAAGPILYAAARQRPAALAFLDGFVLVSIAGLVVLEVVPGTFTAGGAWSFAFLLAGLFGPTLLERFFREAEREAHIAALLLAVCGLVLHALADGTVLTPGASDDWALPLAVVLHSVPVGMAVWWLLAPHFGTWPPLLAMLAMCVGTIVGYRYGVSLNEMLSDQAWAWFQSVVAGSILHVIFGRPHLHGDEDPHHAHVERAPAPVARYEGVGNLLALGALALIGTIHASAEGDSPVLDRFMDLALESAPALLAAYVLGAFIYGDLPGRIVRWLSAGGRLSQSLRGTAVGLPLAICSCSALPLYHSLSKRGVAPAAALAFLVAAPEVGLTALLVSLPLLGFEMTLIRVGAAAALAILVGYVVAAWARPALPAFTPVAEGAGHAHAHDVHCAHDHHHGGDPSLRSGRHGRLRRFLHAGFVELVDGTAPWIVLGLVVAAVAEPLLMQVLWTSWPDALEVAIFALVGMPIFVCAAGATPLIAVLLAAGVSPGAALAFLLTGPATNVSTFGVLARLHGRRMAWIFAVVAAAGAIGLGLLVNLVPLPPVPAAALEHEPASLLEQLSLAALALLYAASLLRRGARAFLAELLDTGAPAEAHSH